MSLLMHCRGDDALLREAQPGKLYRMAPAGV